MTHRPDPLHTLNSLPPAEVAGLAASTPASVATRFGAHRRQFPDPALDVMELTRPFLFRDLPGRMDGGVDEQWGRRSHRARSIYRSWSVGRAQRRVSSARFVQRRPGNGVLRGLLIGLALELAAALAIVGIVVARKLY